MELVPERSATLTVAPAALPYSADELLVTTWNSATESGGGCITWFEKPWFDVPYALLSTPSRRKLLNVLRRPLTLYAPSRVRTVTALPVPMGENLVPAVSSNSDEYSRPFSGSSFTASPPITWPR